MLDGVNDQPEHAQQLVAAGAKHGGRGVSCKFNLIPFNPFPASGLLRSPQPRVLAFAKMLSDAGIVTTVRKTRGDDIDAACGQLAGDVKDRTRAAERMRASKRTVMLHTGAAPRRLRRPRSTEAMSNAFPARTRLVAAACAWPAGWLVAGCALGGLRTPARASTAGSGADIVTDVGRSRRPQARAHPPRTGDRLFRAGPDHGGARRDSSRSLAADPTFSDAYNLRGLIYMRLDDCRPGRRQLPPRHRAQSARRRTRMHNYGWLLCQQNRYDESHAAVQRGAGQSRSTPTAPRR